MQPSPNSKKTHDLVPAVTIRHPLIEQWELWQFAARRSDVTISERIRVVTLFAEETGCSPVSAQPIEIIHWMNRHTEWSGATAATYHSYLRAWFKWLTIMDHRIDDPMVKLGAPRYPERVPRPVSDDDLVRLLLTPMHHRTRVMILLAALGGLRVAEISRVRGEDIDIAKPAIHVVGKGKRSAWLPLHVLLVDAALTMPTRGWWFPANSRRPGAMCIPNRSATSSATRCAAPACAAHRMGSGTGTAPHCSMTAPICAPCKSFCGTARCRPPRSTPV